MKNLSTTLISLLLTGLLFWSNTTSGQAIYTEEFNYTAGAIPPGWVLEAEQAPPWSVNVSQVAGGEAPELYLGYSFAAGFSRLISTPIDVTGQQELHLRYKQYLINYEMDYGEVIGMDVTFDGGTTWQVIWEQPLGTLNIVADEYHYYIAVPEGATSMQYAFRYEGNSYAINFWCIDDVIFEPSASNDLVNIDFKGSITPVAAKANVYTIKALNGGSEPQDSYIVKLLREDGTILASVPGELIAFGDTVVYELSWTPEASETGTFNIYASVELTGDEIMENNQSHLMEVAVQPEPVVTVEIGNGFTPEKFIPYNFFNLYSFTQSLVFADEIGMSGKEIVGLQYTAQFDEDEEGVEIELMLGETTRTNLTDDWVDPAGLKLVFDGSINFKKGLNNFFIPFDEPYMYNGGNLVIQSVKGYSEQYLFVSFISTFDSLCQRSRAAERDDAPFNSLETPPYGYTVDFYPNITLLYSTQPVSVNSPEPAVVNIYPNPTSGALYVQADQNIHEITVTDLLGREVYRQPATGTLLRIETANLEPGIYMLQLTTDAGSSVRKIQVLR